MKFVLEAAVLLSLVQGYFKDGEDTGRGGTQAILPAGYESLRCLSSKLPRWIGDSHWHNKVRYSYMCMSLSVEPCTGLMLFTQHDLCGCIIHCFCCTVCCNGCTRSSLFCMDTSMVRSMVRLSPPRIPFSGNGRDAAACSLCSRFICLCCPQLGCVNVMPALQAQQAYNTCH